MYVLPIINGFVHWMKQYHCTCLLNGVFSFIIDCSYSVLGLVVLSDCHSNRHSTKYHMFLK